MSLALSILHFDLLLIYVHGLCIRYLAAAEDTLIPYRFSVYDLLVLPPSFPYGGMVSSEHVIRTSRFATTSEQENACLTFLTPSKFMFFQVARPLYDTNV